MIATMPRRSTASAARAAFGALRCSATSPCCARTSRSSSRALLQPFLLVFVFTYVFPKIGQSVGGSGAPAAQFDPARGRRGGPVDPVPGHPVGGPPDGHRVRRHPRDRRPGAGAHAGVAHRRREDRRRCPPGPAGPVLLVFIAAVVPATPVHLSIDWPVLLTPRPAGVAAAALGPLGTLLFKSFNSRKCFPLNEFHRSTATRGNESHLIAKIELIHGSNTVATN